MWLLLAFLSATLLGFYDVFKKQSLKDNAVLPVLFLNTFFSSLVFLPFILLSVYEPDLLGGTIFNVPVAGWEQHKYIIIKSFIVLSSWIFGYFGMKHLPITIVGRGKLSVEDFRRIIEQQDRCKAGTSAPGQALFLVNVEYPETLFT